MILDRPWTLSLMLRIPSSTYNSNCSEVCSRSVSRTFFSTSRVCRLQTSGSKENGISTACPTGENASFLHVKIGLPEYGDGIQGKWSIPDCQVLHHTGSPKYTYQVRTGTEYREGTWYPVPLGSPIFDVEALTLASKGRNRSPLIGREMLIWNDLHSVIIMIIITPLCFRSCQCSDVL